MINIHKWTSPLGELMLGSYQDKLCLCDWTASRRNHETLSTLCRTLSAELREESTPVIEVAISLLREYFAGERQEFDLPLLITGTDFQQRVRRQLLRLPYGSSVTYSELAAMVGCRGGARAVAAAVASNPLSIFVPCHRIIGAGGRLTGYAGGTDTKAALLSLEGATLPMHNSQLSAMHK